MFSREQVCGGSFTVHGCSRQRLQSTHQYCIAACGSPNTTDRCQEKNQRPGISAPIPMRGGKSAQKGSSIRARALLSGLSCIQWLQLRPVGSNIEENCAGVATRLRATDQGGKVKCYYITQDSHNARHT